MDPGEKILRATVDRFEGDKAVLVLDGTGDKLILSRSALPEDVKEGDVLSISIKIDRESTEKTREQTTELIKKLAKDEKES